MGLKCICNFCTV